MSGQDIKKIQKEFFEKARASSFLFIYGPITSCKKQRKNMKGFRAALRQKFWPFERKQEFWKYGTYVSLYFILYLILKNVTLGQIDLWTPFTGQQEFTNKNPILSLSLSPSHSIQKFEKNKESCDLSIANWRTNERSWISRTHSAKLGV